MRSLFLFAICVLPWIQAEAQIPRKNLNVHRDPARLTASDAMDMKSDRCFHQLLENAHIRVFRVDIAAGESTQLNSHRHDYLVVSLGQSKFEVSGGLNSFPFDMDDGQMQVLTGGWPHRLVNRRQVPLRLVIAEVSRNIHPERPLCGLGGQACTDGKFGATDQGKYTRSTLFETDTVKLARIELGPGGALPEQLYGTGHVLVALADAQLRDDSQKAGNNPIQLKAGEAIWYGPDAVHRLKNMADQDIRLITLELK